MTLVRVSLTLRLTLTEAKADCFSVREKDLGLNSSHNRTRNNGIYNKSRVGGEEMSVDGKTAKRKIRGEIILANLT
jgi:hypothetical protein